MHTMHGCECHVVTVMFDEFNPTGLGGGLDPFGLSSGFGLMLSPFDALCIIKSYYLHWTKQVQIGL